MTATSSFVRDGVRIAYEVAGEGAPIVLVHGFASSRTTNWRVTSWVDTLTRAGLRIAMLDNRGHGDSDKPHNPAAYGDETMAADVLGLMDHLELERPFLMGYSMGAYISVKVLTLAPERIRAAVLGGIGERSITASTAHAERIAAALEAPTAEAVTDPLAKTYRVFADSQNADRLALAACIRFRRPAFEEAVLGRIDVPVLVATGDKDEGMGAPGPFADLFARGEAMVIPNRDHMRATGDPAFKSAALAFLGRQ